MGTSISFKRPDGKEAKGYLANAQTGNQAADVISQHLNDDDDGNCQNDDLQSRTRKREQRFFDGDSSEGIESPAC